MTVDEKVWKLAQLLHNKTASGKIKWDQSPSKNSFLTAFPNYSVQISEGWGLQGAQLSPLVAGDKTLTYHYPAPKLYTISIFNEDGGLVEQAGDSTIKATVKGADPDPSTLMAELYSMARRSAAGADAALDELIAELEVLRS
jgi:hypothetical protein